MHFMYISYMDNLINTHLSIVYWSLSIGMDRLVHAFINLKVVLHAIVLPHSHVEIVGGKSQK